MSKQTVLFFSPDVDKPDWNEALQAAHLRVTDVADKAGIGRSTLFAWLNGSQGMPVDRVPALEKVLDVEGMFTGNLGDEAAAPKTSPAASSAETADERQLAATSPSADAPEVTATDDASAAGELDGATTAPDDGVRPSDAGEFAAMWNAWDEDYRVKWLDQVKKNADTAAKCWDNKHIERLQTPEIALVEHRRILDEQEAKYRTEVAKLNSQLESLGSDYREARAAHELAAAEREALDRQLDSERDGHRTVVEKLNEQLESLGREYHEAMAKPRPVVPIGVPTTPQIEWPAPMMTPVSWAPEAMLRHILDELAKLDEADVDSLLIAVKVLRQLEAAIL